MIEEIEDLQVSMMADKERWYWHKIAADIPFPLGWELSEKLFAKMSKRFEHWTGRTIEQHLAARASVIK